MSSHLCCKAVSTGSSRGAARARIAGGGPHPPSPARRWLERTGWVVPAGVLAVLPKCPLCVAAYFMIASGVGISMSTASYLRLALVMLCVVSLACFAATLVRRALGATAHSVRSSPGVAPMSTPA